MRVLAIDLGTLRIGTAVSDELGITVRPVETIKRSNPDKDIARLRQLAAELEAQAIVVGLPLRLDGTVGSAAKRANKFADRLRKELAIEVFTQDERLTSYEADQLMIGQGIRSRQRRQKSDEIAATLILRDFLSQAKTNN